MVMSDYDEVVGELYKLDMRSRELWSLRDEASDTPLEEEPWYEEFLKIQEDQEILKVVLGAFELIL